MFPQLFKFGDFFLPTYGLLVATGFLLGLWVASRLAKRDGADPEEIVNLGVYCALAGIAGAKVLMFAFDWTYYSRNPGEIFSLSTLQAGGVFQGGLVLALAVGLYYMRRKNLPFLATTDAFAPGIALGHAIGRLGCFAAGCCWGIECSRPWAVTFTDPVAERLFGTPLHRPLHPTQLYEAALEAIIFVILYRRFSPVRRPGSVIGLYLVLSSLGRFVVEFLRFHGQGNPFGGPLSVTQWIALILLAAGAWLLTRRANPPSAHRRAAA
jgi:phosphatidylglycerol:prolipoprotein diacylglycerol transferase